MWRCLRCGEEVNKIRRFDDKVVEMEEEEVEEEEVEEVEEEEVEEEEERVDDTSQEKDYQSADNE